MVPGSIKWGGAGTQSECVQLGDLLTCHIKLDLQNYFAGQCGIPQQLVGFFHGPILSGDAIDGQDTVPHLQQTTPNPQSPVERRSQ